MPGITVNAVPVPTLSAERSPQDATRVSHALPIRIVGAGSIAREPVGAKWQSVPKAEVRGVWFTGNI